MSLKVLHLVAGDLSEGAARGAYWLHRGLLEIGVESKMIIQNNDGGDPTVESVAKNKFQKLTVLLRIAIDRLPAEFYHNREKSIFSTGLSGFDIRKLNDYYSADIIHLHWINNGMINLKLLKKIGKPIVWTMRDMWTMTGGCHYALECKGYESGCGNCPRLKSHSKYDLSRYVLNRKKRCYPENLHLVTISNWLANCAKNSYLLDEYNIEVIPNAVDTKDFFPIDKMIARKLLGLSEDKKIVLAGSADINDKYKGFEKFKNSIKYLDKNYLFLFFGKASIKELDNLEINYESLGFLKDTISLRIAYSAADVFVAPSIQEAFGKTIIEAMACATPVVAFNATGPKDIVEHKRTGYLAKPFDSEDLARGINWVLEDKERLKELSKQSEIKIKNEFSIRIIATKYVELYKEILK